MIRFATLKVSGECRQLVIDASIEAYSFYDDVYIDSVVIDTQDTFITSGPSSSSVYTKSIDGNSKHVTLILDKTDFNAAVDFGKDLFFVYITVKGTMAPDTPCGYDRYYDLGIAVNIHNLYKSLMGGIRQVEETCNIPKQLIDKYLQLKAFTTSLKTGNYTLAIKYWNKFFRNCVITDDTSTKCKCSLWIT